MKGIKKILFGIALILLGMYCLHDGVEMPSISLIAVIAGTTFSVVGFFQKET